MAASSNPNGKRIWAFSEVLAGAHDESTLVGIAHFLVYGTLMGCTVLFDMIP